MCGIVGLVNLNQEPASAVLIRKMTDKIAHRGPDGEGQYVDGPVGLGHRRLAIIDLSAAGRQPMQTRDGRYVISYNGEVYNFRELKTELESLGHQFRSRTDSEVVLNAFAQWGTECVHRLNGMFAFAILDRKEKKLFIARDRYGIKPLYYSLNAKAFVFASEAKAILEHPDIATTIDKEALLEYFTFQNFFTSRTLIESIKTFPAGHFAYIDLNKNVSKINLSEFWDYSFEEPEQGASEEEYIEELDRLFLQAVNRQIVSDVDLGAYLSGGTDSGSITALAAKQLPYMKSFTVGFDLHSASGMELAFDERQKAEAMSYLFKTEHYEMVLKSGDLERVLPRLGYHLEEPRVGQSYPNFYAAQLASKFVKVVLCGTGGDELFAGYPWRYYRAVVNEDFSNYIEKYYTYWQRLIPNRLIKEVFKPIWPEIKHVWTRDIFESVFKKHAEKLNRPEDYINHSLYFESKTFLHGLLIVEDKLSMAHGLESRVPFLDNDLVDFAMKVPARFKLNNLESVVRLNENQPGSKARSYFEKTRDGKLLLRKVMSKYVPEEVSNRIKQGFSAPDASWFRGDSIEFVKAVLGNSKNSIYNYMDFNSVSGLLKEHFDGEKNRRLFIWSLLNFDQSLRRFF